MQFAFCDLNRMKRTKINEKEAGKGALNHFSIIKKLLNKKHYQRFAMIPLVSSVIYYPSLTKIFHFRLRDSLLT